MSADTASRDVPGLLALLGERFGDGVDGLQALSGGFFSDAYAFTAGGREYVVRLNSEIHARGSFAKDDYAWKHFASPALPIPRIVAIGEISGGYYAISERAGGRPLSECTRAERRAALPALLDMLEEVGKADVRASSGYGDWGSDGNGKFASWRDFLASTAENHADGYYENWHRLFHDSFLERDVYETVFDRMLRLTQYCPEKRALIHNDFQFENILSDAGRITGVIDWANALYGDPLYDVAWLSWLSVHPGWWYDDGTEILRERFGAAPDYETRIACYQLQIGLDHLRFYAKNDNWSDYQFSRDWLLALAAAVA
jgi:hygromycin-B 4-O-kinase